MITAILFNLMNMLGLYGAWAVVQILKLFGARLPREIGYRAGDSLLHYSTILYNCKRK